MTKPRVVVFGGSKQSGKDTSANILTTLLHNEGISTVKFSFGHRMIMQVAEMLDIAPMEIVRNKEFFRPILQWYPNEFRREYMKTNEYWLNYIIYDLNDLFRRSPNAIGIVTGTRYPFELKKLESLYRTTTVWIDKEVKRDKLSSHSTECSLFKKDFKLSISNNSTINALESEISRLMDTILI